MYVYIYKRKITHLKTGKWTPVVCTRDRTKKITKVKLFIYLFFCSLSYFCSMYNSLYMISINSFLCVFVYIGLWDNNFFSYFTQEDSSTFYPQQEMTLLQRQRCSNFFSSDTGIQQQLYNFTTTESFLRLQDDDDDDDDLTSTNFSGLNTKHYINNKRRLLFNAATPRL